MTVILYQKVKQNSNEIRYLDDVIKIEDANGIISIHFRNDQVFRYNQYDFYKMEILKDTN